MGKVPVVPALSAAQIEDKANRLLHEYAPKVWEKGKPVPVDNIFEIYIPDELGIRTAYTDLQKLGVNAEGYTNARQMISIVDESLSDDFSVSGTRRFRSTSGHEIGHCVLHVPLERWQQSLQIVGRGMKRERSDMKPFEDPEWQAWRFCLALCMPENIVKKMAAQYGTDNYGVKAMMDRFNMNYTFVTSRLKSLKMISADSGNYQRKRNLPRISN